MIGKLFERRMTTNQKMMKRGIYKGLILTFMSLIVWSCDNDSFHISQIPEGVSIQDSYFVQIDLTDHSHDTFKVDIYLDGLSPDEDIFQFAATIPGTYSISDIGRFVRTFHVYDKASNEISTERISTNQWQIARPNDAFLIRYEVYDIWDFEVTENQIYRMSSTSIEWDHALLNTPGVIGYVSGNRDRNYYIHIKTPTLWSVATALRKDENGVYIAEDFDHLVDSPFLLADLSTTNTLIGNTEIGVHTYSAEKQISSGEILNDIEQVMLDAQAFLKVLPVDHYDYLFHFSEKSAGALEHSHSSVYVLRDGPYTNGMRNLLKGITAHEFFHIVTPLNIHSELIEDFNYVTPTPSAHLWLYEGVTEWASDMMQYRNGSTSLSFLFGELKRKAQVGSWYDPDFSLTRLSLESYTPAGQGQYANIYYRGAMIATLLDIRLLQLSDGTYGLRELVLDLIETYGPERSFPEDRFIDIIIDMTYPEVQDFFDNYVSGTTPIPITEYFESLGISYDPGSHEFTEMDSKTASQSQLFEAWSKNL